MKANVKPRKDLSKNQSNWGMPLTLSLHPLGLEHGSRCVYILLQLEDRGVLLLK